MKLNWDKIVWYDAQRNSDLTEGRGGDVTFASFWDLNDAIAAVQNASTQGSHGSVTEVTVDPDWEPGPDKPRSPLIVKKIWGRRANLDGKGWSYGFLDFRESVNDPEWPEYIRLCEKFKGV